MSVKKRTLEIGRKFFIFSGKEIHVSGIAYMPLTSRLHHAYVAAYIAAYIHLLRRLLSNATGTRDTLIYRFGSGLLRDF